MSWEDFLSAHAWKLILLLVLLAGSGFFSGTETAMFNLTRGQLFRLSRSRHKLERFVASLMRAPQRMLNTLLLGNMLVNVAFAAFSAVMVLDLKRAGAAGYVVALASLIPLLVLILGGEVMPKMLAMALGERWALTAALPMSFVGRILLPPLWLLEKGFVSPLSNILTPRSVEKPDISAEELDALLDLSAKRGVIDRDASELLQEIIELADLRVRDVMVHRLDVIAFDADGSSQALAELFGRTRLRKIPVYERDMDHILGLIHAKRFFLNRDAPLRGLITDVSFVPEAANLERILFHFRRTHTQMAIVVDEYGGTAGLVTLKDVLEEVVGDIPDLHEADRGPAVQHITDREYSLDGDLAIHEWYDAFKMDLTGHRISTIGGFVISLLGRIPQAGDVATYRNLRFTVDSMRGRRIGQLRLELLEPPA